MVWLGCGGDFSGACDRVVGLELSVLVQHRWKGVGNGRGGAIRASELFVRLVGQVGQPLICGRLIKVPVKKVFGDWLARISPRRAARIPGCRCRGDGGGRSEGTMGLGDLRSHECVGDVRSAHDHDVCRLCLISRLNL